MFVFATSSTPRLSPVPGGLPGVPSGVCGRMWPSSSALGVIWPEPLPAAGSLAARRATRLAFVPGGFAAPPSEFSGYAPLMFVPSVRSAARLACVPGGLPGVPSGVRGRTLPSSSARRGAPRPDAAAVPARDAARPAAVPGGFAAVWSAPRGLDRHCETHPARFGP